MAEDFDLDRNKYALAHIILLQNLVSSFIDFFQASCQVELEVDEPNPRLSWFLLGGRFKSF
jgi:hypothetical protein